METWFVYIAQCADQTLYVGIARDVAARIAAHDAGRGARYTRGRGPLVVLAKRRCTTKGDALRLEMAVKRLGREQKLAVAASRRKMAALAKAVAEARDESVQGLRRGKTKTRRARSDSSVSAS